MTAPCNPLCYPGFVKTVSIYTAVLLEGPMWKHEWWKSVDGIMRSRGGIPRECGMLIMSYLYTCVTHTQTVNRYLCRSNVVWPECYLLAVFYVMFNKYMTFTSHWNFLTAAFKWNIVHISNEISRSYIVAQYFMHTSFDSVVAPCTHNIISVSFLKRHASAILRMCIVCIQKHGLYL